MRQIEIVRIYFALFVVLVAFGIPTMALRFPDQLAAVESVFSDATSQLAAIILAHSPKSISDIRSNYPSQTTIPFISPKKVRVLIVPGHEPTYGGAEYKNLKERDMTVLLGQDLQTFLQNDGHYQTFITRSTTAWSPVFASYFGSQMDAIALWRQAYTAEMSQMIALGSTTLAKSNIIHNSVPNNVALRLYGITKWANENDIDITIHIHFNDDPVRSGDNPGKYSGLAVYVPVAQYENSTTTHAVADAVFNRLAKYNPTSDLPAESMGIVDDPELIAVGANDTADSASMLIEYAYIYEPQFTDPDTRDLAIKDLAYQTYLGLEDFFNPKSARTLGPPYDTVVLPHSWNNPISASDTGSTDIFALQTALSLDGEYPPPYMSKNDCPRTGKIGACTKAALSAFQGKYGITGEDGTVGVKTIQLLNQRY
jgi:N-acetylmuramoyl-L-alanine amidase